MEDKLKQLILLMEIKNEEKFSDFSKSIEQLDKQDIELSNDVDLLYKELSKIEDGIKSFDVSEQIKELKSDIENIQLQKGDKGDNGKDGYTPIKGIDYFDGTNGRDGKDGKDGENGEKGEDGSPDTPEQIVEKINTLENVIEIKTIKDFPVIEGTADIKRQIDTIGNQVLRLLSKPTQTVDLSGYVPTSRTLTINGTSYDLSTDRTWSVGTVTSVAALTLGTTGTDLSSSVATGTTTPVITLNVPTASATNRGALSSTDWTTFNNKFTLPSLTSGSVLFSNGTTIAQDNANFFWNDTNNRLGIGTASPAYSLDVTGDIRSSGLYRFSGSPTISNASSALNFNADNGFVLNANNAASNLITVSNAGVYGFTSGFTSSYTNPWMSLGLLRENSSQWRGNIGYPIGIHNLAGDISFTQNTGVTYGAVVVPTETVRFKAGGYVGIGQSSPTAVLHLKAGTATASTAPLKFTTGTLNTVAEAGTIEYVSPNFYFTPVSGERITFGMGAATNNTVVGKGAGGSLSSGVQNTFYGVGAGGTNSNTHYNTCFGHLAGNTTYGNTSYNTFIGWQAGASSIQFTGGGTGIGANAFVYGVDGISIGHTAQAGGGTGIISIGAGITANTTAGAGDHNISIGYQSTTSVLTGADNIAIGYKSGNIMTSGAFNILMGYKAGDTITTGSNNVIIGKDIDAQGATTSNQLSIQNAIFGTGNSGTGTTASTGKIGIYTVAPTCALDVTGGIATSRTAVTAPATTDGNIFSGTYTPTLTGITNVTSSTAYVCQYMRVGNVVTVSGKIEVTPTANNTQTTIGISLPIASNFANSGECGGSSHTVANTTAGHGGAIYADATNDRAEMDYFETHGASDTFAFSFTYQII